MACALYPQQRAEDVYLHHCYLYYVCGHPRMADNEFDRMATYFRQQYPSSQVLQWVGSDNPNHYPEYIREWRRPRGNERRLPIV